MAVCRPLRATLALLALACALGAALAPAGIAAREPEDRGPLSEPEIRGGGPGSSSGESGSHGHGTDDVKVDDRPEAPPPAGGPQGHPLDARHRGAATFQAVRASLPTTWCGAGRSQDDLEHELHRGVRTLHAVYAVAADAPNRLRSFASAIQTDAFQASALLEQLYGRALRFDLGTSCGAQYLDISIVRLPQTRADLTALAAQPDGTFDAVAAGLDRAGFGVERPGEPMATLQQRTKNWVVWLDAPAPPDACGQATMPSDLTRDPGANRANHGGKIAVVFHDGARFCNSTAVRHEVAHTLGAVQLPAPHGTLGHCTDADNDTMCLSGPAAPAAPSADGFFDFNNDDYWSAPGRPLGWWTVDQSGFVCGDAACNVPPPAPTVKLTVLQRLRPGYVVALAAAGEGRAEVTVRCRRPGGRTRTVLTRRVKLPRTVRARVACASPARAQIRAL